jgi:hypothetical protein
MSLLDKEKQKLVARIKRVPGPSRARPIHILIIMSQ